MESPRHRFLHLAAGAAVLIALLAVPAHRAFTQGARTIRLVVPYPPGGGIDSTARLMAEEVGRAQGVTVVVENRPGAGTVIATDAVSRAKPDGNTLLLTLNTFLVAAHTHKLSYDPLTSFEPICKTASTPQVIVVDARSSYRNFDDLVQAARDKPGALTYAQVTGTATMIGFEMLNRDTGMKLTFVPFAGNVPAVTAVLGGHVNATVVDYPSASGHLCGRAHRRRARLQGHRPRPLVRPVCTESHAEGAHRSACRLVHHLDQSPRDPRQARCPRDQGRRAVRRSIRGLPAPAIRRIRSHHSRGRHQGRVNRLLKDALPASRLI